jgi:glycosyltransferase involved in cell wall biosynthesis
MPTPRAAGDQPLRVALVTDWALPRRGGIELHLADLAARLRAAGHVADVLTPMPGDDADGVRRLRVPRLPMAGIACTPAIGRALRDALGDGRYDVVHAHASVVSPAAFAAAAIARGLGVPCTMTFHSMLHTSGRVLAAAHALTGWARAPLLLTGVSTRVAAQLRAALPRARVAVLPNATDVAWWRTPPDDAARALLAERLPPRAPGEVRVVTAMRLTRKKRTADLARMVDALRRARGASDAPVRVIVAGDGPDRTALARAAGGDGALTLLGWQPRAVLRALYADADLFALPAVHESFGIAALEARAAGLPVLARAGAGVADFVRHDVDGVLAADADALVRAAVALVDDAARRATLASAARDEPPCAFDWARVTAAHVALYRALQAGDVRAMCDPSCGVSCAPVHG